MLEQFYSGGEAMREGSDVGQSSMEYAEVKASAASNPLFIEEVQLGKKVRDLNLDRQAFESDRFRARQKFDNLSRYVIPGAEARISSLEKGIAEHEQRMASLPKDAKVELKIGDETHHDTKEAGQALVDRLGEIGRHLPIRQIKEGASKWAIDHEAEVSAAIEIGSVYGRPLYVQVGGGWRNSETGETLAGNDEQLALRRKMPRETQDKFEWSYSTAIWGFKLDDKGNVIRAGTNFEGSVQGNVTKINNFFRGQPEALTQAMAELESKRADLPTLEQAAKGRLSETGGTRRSNLAADGSAAGTRRCVWRRCSQGLGHVPIPD